MKKIFIIMIAISIIAAPAAATESRIEKIELGSEPSTTESSGDYVTKKGTVYVGMPEEQLGAIFEPSDMVLVPHKTVGQGWVVFRNIVSSKRNDVITFYITNGKVSGWRMFFDHTPQNKGSMYELTGTENIRVWFFPHDKARWNGRRVTLLDWNKLVDVQKVMFIKEYISMLNLRFNKNAMIDIDRYILAMNFYTDNCPDKCRYVGAAEALDQLLISDGKAKSIEDIK